MIRPDPSNPRPLAAPVVCLSQGVDWPFVWAWGQPADPYTRRAGIFDRERKGERCRVVVRLPLNSALVEFESDGWRVVTSRSGLRRAR